ncbi:MAG: hypothetical protein H7A21_02180 [Spirochaetales bacterium]|nr:hypothetical protein [Leptospiraceae bacterium]MCP5480215.1 hypothetical protein [Spirochaetales bacterium]MCP5486386.1 hypothetical protein [Spirochaetales bacterium]
MFVNEDRQAMLRDFTDAAIGLTRTVEDFVRWNAARVLIRWNALVLRGEDDLSPVSMGLKRALDDWLLREEGPKKPVDTDARTPQF